MVDKVRDPAKEGNSQSLCWEQRVASTLQYWVRHATVQKMINSLCAIESNLIYHSHWYLEYCVYLTFEITFFSIVVKEIIFITN